MIFWPLAAAFLVGLFTAPQTTDAIWSTIAVAIFLLVGPTICVWNLRQARLRKSLTVQEPFGSRVVREKDDPVSFRIAVGSYWVFLFGFPAVALLVIYDRLMS